MVSKNAIVSLFLKCTARNPTRAEYGPIVREIIEAEGEEAFQYVLTSEDFVEGTAEHNVVSQAFGGIIAIRPYDGPVDEVPV